MKVSNEFILRQLAGENLLVPVGSAAARFNGLITMNELGCFIFEALQTEHSRDQLLEAILTEYEVDEAAASADLDGFLDQLRELGALIEA